jgi:hypothetical protein
VLESAPDTYDVVRCEPGVDLTKSTRRSRDPKLRDFRDRKIRQQVIVEKSELFRVSSDIKAFEVSKASTFAQPIPQGLVVNYP